MFLETLTLVIFCKEVNVMLQLNVLNENGNIQDEGKLQQQLQQLKQGQVSGVMCDIWWGIVEKTPGVYEFDGYQRINELAMGLGLKFQPVMSFHKCGGNVGDNCNIPIPQWVRDAGHQHDSFFKDQQGHVDDEYIGFGADQLRVFPGYDCQNCRTPLQLYSDFMAAFEQKFEQSLFSKQINNIQVGAGPCGELRYPSYQLDRWNFPGIGEFQCWDEHLLAAFKSSAAKAGHPEWDKPPSDAGSYNSRPEQTLFFTNGYKMEYGDFFTHWYESVLLDHGAQLLKAAREIFASTPLSMKVAGIHWWAGAESRAAEKTAGYSNYQNFADLFEQFDADFDFTCMEMQDFEQDGSAFCKPEELVREVADAVSAVGGSWSGENALERYDKNAYQQVIRQIKYRSGSFGAFTYLRLGDKLLNEGWPAFFDFVQEVRRIE